MPSQKTELSTHRSRVDYLKDIHGKYSYVSERLGRLLGVRPEDVIGKTDRYFLQPETILLSGRTDEVILNTGNGSTITTYLGHQLVNISKTPFRDRAGTIIGIVGVISEIRNTILRITLSRTVRVSELGQLLEAANTAYASVVYCNDILPEELEDLAYDTAADRGVATRSARFEQGIQEVSIPKPLSPDLEPLIGRMHFESPGWWEMLGTWNPIKQIVDYLKFRVEMTDKTKTNDIKRYELQLKNMLLETKVIESRIAALKSMGVDEKRIQTILNVHLIQPLDRLALFQESGLISEVSMSDTETIPPKSPSENS